MSKKGTFLDVDPSIVERNLRITDTSFEEELKHLFPAQPDAVPSKLIKPTPGCCIKSKSSDNEKIFINVCQADAIPPPKDMSESELMELFQSEPPWDFRIPMSIGEGRIEKDKSGNDATVYDVAINPEFFVKVEKSELFRTFFFTVIFEGLQDKYNITLVSESMTVLKNRKVMGTLQMHRIQQRDMDKKMNKEKKLIEEIASQSFQSQENKETVRKDTTQSKAPPFRLLELDKKVLLCEVLIPDVVNVNDIILDVGEDRIVLEYSRKKVFLDIFIPRIVQQDGVTANMNKSNGILTITMPVVRTA